MAHHELTTPVTEAQVCALHIDDTVTLQGILFGIRDATQIALFDRGRTTRFDLAGHAVIHTAPNVKKVPLSPTHPAGYAPLCVGTAQWPRGPPLARKRAGGLALAMAAAIGMKRRYLICWEKQKAATARGRGWSGDGFSQYETTDVPMWPRPKTCSQAKNRRWGLGHTGGLST